MTHQAKNAAPIHGKQRSLLNPHREFNNLSKRQQACLAALRQNPVPREQLDRETGASNGPQIVFELRKLGFEIPCQRVSRVDRYGQPCKPGIYSLSASDRELLEGVRQ
jgi:hypothetical protein